MELKCLHQITSTSTLFCHPIPHPHNRPPLLAPPPPNYQREFEHPVAHHHPIIVVVEASLSFSWRAASSCRPSPSSCRPSLSSCRVVVIMPLVAIVVPLRRVARCRRCAACRPDAPKSSSLCRPSSSSCCPSRCLAACRPAAPCRCRAARLHAARHRRRAARRCPRMCILFCILVPAGPHIPESVASTESAEHTSELNHSRARLICSGIRRNPEFRPKFRREGPLTWYSVPRVTNIH